MGNTFKTVFLLGALTGLLVVFGNYFGGTQGMMIAFLFALLMNFGAYWFSDKIVLSMYRARQVTEAEAPELVGLDRSGPGPERLCHRSKPGARRRRGDRGAPADHEPRPARRGVGP